MKKIFILSAALIMAGCATKQYPQAANVTGPESSAMDCKAVALEIAKTRSVQQEIEATGEFDRLNQLEALKAAKCADQ
ncbi:hypothetical protein [Escherichia coli]|uniref:hypothetical protein n=1 Tax=Escherichia coli TaxID=562 RepID=UPI000BB73092|nr:hypothetical protein [Escherichia coli]